MPHRNARVDSGYLGKDSLRPDFEQIQFDTKTMFLTTSFLSSSKASKNKSVVREVREVIVLGRRDRQRRPCWEYPPVAQCRLCWRGSGERAGKLSRCRSRRGQTMSSWTRGLGVRTVPCPQGSEVNGNAHKPPSSACHVTYKKCWPWRLLAWELGKHQGKEAGRRFVRHASFVSTRTRRMVH